MKKLIIILSVLFTLMIAGVLYGKNKQPDWVKIMTVDPCPVYMTQFPDPIPDFVLY
jgi:hypothetical protein